MELGTFGAILRFAIEQEQRAAGFYEQAGGVALFEEMAQGARKRVGRLEQARREGIAEMILESISGLDGDSYSVAIDPQADEAGRLAQARALEKAATRFYQDAAAKLPIREVSRLFQRLAQDHGQRRGQLPDAP